MRLGTSYMGHHNPRHMQTDLTDMKAIGCDDVLLAAQENDFEHMIGKVEYFPKIAADVGIRPIAIFWGALNLFGGGKSSQFLLHHPEGFQVRRDGSRSPAGCYNNPVCVGRIKEMIDRIVELGYQGYFVDEPTPIDCYCPSCRELYGRWHDGELVAAGKDRLDQFRHRCVINYIETISTHCKDNHPALETICCLMPSDRAMWRAAAEIPTLDNLGTDIYWAFPDHAETDMDKEMTPIVRDLAGICASAGKKHHEWLQAWKVPSGLERLVTAQGRVLVREQPDGLYVWAYLAQIGTNEASEDCTATWSAVRELFEQARASS